MQIEMIKAPENIPLERIYIAAATLRSFQNKKDVEVHLLRIGATPAEMAELAKLDIVGPPEPDIPAQILAGATREAALACLLETFTGAEVEQLARYLEERYSEQISRLMIGPMDLPVPLGAGPLAAIPESASSGFINFDLAPDYPLDFRFKGFYISSEE